jgi:hypothetical protein
MQHELSGHTTTTFVANRPVTRQGKDDTRLAASYDFLVVDLNSFQGMGPRMRGQKDIVGV